LTLLASKGRTYVPFLRRKKKEKKTLPDNDWGRKRVKNLPVPSGG